MFPMTAQLYPYVHVHQLHCGISAGAGGLMVWASALHAEGTSPAPAHSPIFFLSGICCVGVDLCCLILLFFLSKMLPNTVVFHIKMYPITSCSFQQPLQKLDTEVKPTNTFIDLFRSPQLRKETVNLMFNMWVSFLLVISVFTLLLCMYITKKTYLSFINMGPSDYFKYVTLVSLISVDKSLTPTLISVWPGVKNLRVLHFWASLSQSLKWSTSWPRWNDQCMNSVHYYRYEWISGRLIARTLGYMTPGILEPWHYFPLKALIWGKNELLKVQNVGLNHFLRQ